MALTPDEQRAFHAAAMRWLTEQMTAGNDRALYQLWKATTAQVKARIDPYLTTALTAVTTTQSGSAAAYAAQDAALADAAAVLQSTLADPNP